MSDNGCQPTATSFMAACNALGTHRVFTSYNNPKGNAVTGCFMRLLKEEFVWLKQWISPIAFINELDQWIENYKETYSHSTRGYTSPNAFEHSFLTTHKQQQTLLKLACSTRGITRVRNRLSPGYPYLKTALFLVLISLNF